MIRAVIFDLGHTLWDIGPDDGGLAVAYDAMRATLQQRLARSDLPDARTIRGAVTDVLRDSAETYFTTGAALEQPPSHSWIDQACRRLGLIVDEGTLREVTPRLFGTEIDRLICSEGTADAVLSLADAGYLVGCITNTLADTSTIRAMLRRHGLDEVMRTVVVSADEGFRKPHPSLFEKALRESGVAASEAVYVGDSPYHDIGGAKALGMRAIITRQYVRRPDVEGVPAPDAEISHVRELAELLRQ